MSALALHSQPVPTLPFAAWIHELRKAEPRFMALGVVLLAAMAPTVFAMSVDPRTFDGVNVWQKPFKFELALLVYAASIAFFARYLPDGFTARRGYRIYAGAVIAAIVAEMIWIGAAASLAAPSHFNTTSLGAAVYGLMGVAAVLLTSMSAVLAIQIARNAKTGLAPALHRSIVAGLALVLPLTLMTAGTMSSMGSHAVGSALTGDSGLALMGWLRERGDLRVAHFFATHSMHAIPAFGWVLTRLGGANLTWPVWLFSAFYAGLVAFTFVQALGGHPFLPVF